MLHLVLDYIEHGLPEVEEDDGAGNVAEDYADGA